MAAGVSGLKIDDRVDVTEGDELLVRCGVALRRNRCVLEFRQASRVAAPL